MAPYEFSFNLDFNIYFAFRTHVIQVGNKWCFCKKLPVVNLYYDMKIFLIKLPHCTHQNLVVRVRYGGYFSVFYSRCLFTNEVYFVGSILYICQLHVVSKTMLKWDHLIRELHIIWSNDEHELWQNIKSGHKELIYISQSIIMSSHKNIQNCNYIWKELLFHKC